MSLGAFLTLAAGPIARRALAGVGVGVVTYAGLDTALGGALDAARAAFNGLPSDVMGYVAHAGVHTCFAIIAGAITTRVTMISLKRFAAL